MVTSNIKVILHCDIKKVWEAVLDVDKYSEWRRDLSKTERIDERKFIEYTRGDYPTRFTITAVEPLKRWGVIWKQPLENRIKHKKAECRKAAFSQ